MRFTYFQIVRRLFVTLKLIVLALPVTGTANTATAESVGFIPAQFTIDPSGTATYQLPIEIPPGIQKVQPNLILAYRSQSQNGTVGMGWQLAGLHKITRTRAIIAIDGFAGGINYDQNDRFALDGKRLIEIDTGEYHLEREQWMQLKSSGTASSGAQSFTATTKKGETLSFGGTENSRVTATCNNAVRVWALDSKTDLNGNQIQYSYVQGNIPAQYTTDNSSISSEGQYYPTEIAYTVNGETAANRFVRFSYEPRPDVITHYIGGCQVVTAARLAKVTTYLNNAVVQQYQLQYEIAPATGRSRVVAAKVTAGSSKSAPSLPATQLRYQDQANYYNNVTQVSEEFGSANYWTSQNATPRTLADVNGDGRMDIIGFGEYGKIQVALGQNSGLGQSTTWATLDPSNYVDQAKTPRVMADVNGDGLADVLGFTMYNGFQIGLSTGTSFNFNQWPNQKDFTGSNWNSQLNSFSLADVNGDNLADIVVFRYGVHVMLAQSDGFSSSQKWIDGFSENNGPDGTAWNPNNPRIMADVNGDHCADIVGFSDYNVYVALSNGKDGFETANWSSNGSYNHFTYGRGYSATQGARLTADVNGDGLMDIVGLSPNGGIEVGISTGKGFLPAQSWNSFVYQSGIMPAPAASDVNLDGMIDLVLFNADGAGAVKTLLSTGTHFVAQKWQTLNGFTVNASPLMVADYTGDGLADVIGFESYGVYGAPGAGDYPDLLTTIIDGIGHKTAVVYSNLSDSSVYTDNAGTTSAIGFSATPLPAVAAAIPVFNPKILHGGYLNVVKSYTLNNNTQGTSNINKAPFNYQYQFTYQNAAIDLDGRGWLGFKSLTTLNQETGKRSIKTYHQAFPFTGLLSQSESQCDKSNPIDPKCTQNNTILGRQSITYYCEPGTSCNTSEQQRYQPYSKVYQVLHKSERQDTYDYNQYNFSLGSHYDYDRYGNLTQQSYLGYVNQQGVDQSADDNVYTCTQYQNDTTAWQLGYPTVSKVSASSGCNGFTQFDNNDFHFTEIGYTTDGRMNVASHQQWDNVNNVWLATGYTYDGFGHVLSKNQPGNRVTSYTYEDQYHTYLNTRTSPLNQQGKRLVEQFGFEPRFGLQVAFTDVNQLTHITCVDAFGRIKNEQGPLPVSGNVTADQNCVSSLVTGPSAQFTQAQVVTLENYAHRNDDGYIYVETEQLQSWDNADLRWHRTYLDGLGRSYKQVSQGKASQGNIFSCTVYNSENQIVEDSVPIYAKSTNPDCSAAQLKVTSSYDVYSRITRNVRPAGPNGTEQAVTTTAYSKGDISTITYAAGDAYQYQKILKYRYYDSVKKPVQMIVPGDNNATTVYTYDRLARLTQATDPKTTDNPQGVTNEIAYDSLDRRIWINNPDQNTTGNSNIKAVQSFYDPKTGFLSSQIDAKQQKTGFAYDNWGRLVRKTLADGTIIAYTYDDPKVSNGLGQLTQVVMKDADGTQQYAYNYAYDRYDNRSQTTLAMTGESKPFTTQTAYDPLARLRQLTYPDDTVLNRTYQVGDLRSLTVGNTTYASFSDYTAQGKPQAMAYANGVKTTYHYTPTGEMWQQTITDANNNALLNHTLDLNHLNQVVSITDNLKLGGTDHTQVFSYQSNRLSQAQANGLYGTRKFGYDEAGDLIDNNGISYTYTAHRVIHGTQGKTSVLEASYDANGNLTDKNLLQQRQRWHYQYDVQNRLTQVTKNDRQILSIPLYNQSDRRLKKVDAAGIETLYVSSEYQITKYPDQTVEATKYITAPSGTVAAITAVQSGKADSSSPDGYPTPGTLYFHTNHLSSTSLTTDAKGQLSSQLVYLPYGGVYEPKTTGPNNFRPKFQGKELDAGELYYFGARYYDPSVGRFLTPDTQLASHLYQADAFNRFAFAVNNPVTYIDPTGHSIWDSIGGALIGSLEIAAGMAITAVSDGALEPVGGALIGAGIDAVQYSATHTDNFSWGDYGIQQGMDIALGLATEGLAGEGEALEGAAGREVGEEESAGGDTLVEACVPSSFVAGALVSTDTGLVPIEDIQVGALVLAMNDSTGKSEWKPVLDIFVRTKSQVISLELIDEAGNSEQLLVTPNHPFWVRELGWVEAGELQSGDAIYTLSGEYSQIISKTRIIKKQTVYNFEVDDFHTYFVGKIGVWVHNAKRCKGKGKDERKYTEKDAIKIKKKMYKKRMGREKTRSEYHAEEFLEDVIWDEKRKQPHTTTMIVGYDVNRPQDYVIGRSGMGEHFIGNNKCVGNCAEGHAIAQLWLEKWANLKDMRLTHARNVKTGQITKPCYRCYRLLPYYLFK